MRLLNYKTHWSYLGPAIKRKEPLVDFVLDIFYLMEDSGVVPPFHVLYEVLQTGGDNGGMSPGTSWRPIKIKQAEYQELVQALLDLDIAEAKKKHRYIRFQKVIVDEELHQKPTYQEWRRAVTSKYPPNSK